MRAFLTVLVVLLVVGLAVDRGAELVAERVAADRTRSQLALSEAPDVEVDGFPFLTQLAARRFEQLRLHADAVTVGRVRTGAVEVTAQEVAVDPALPMESEAARLRADVRLPYEELGRLAPEQVTVAAAGSGRVRVSAPLDVPGRDGRVVARSTVTLRDGTVLVRARRVTVAGTPVADTGLASRVRGRLDFAVPVGDLAGGLRLTGVRATGEGLEVSAAGRDLALGRVAAAWR